MAGLVSGGAVNLALVQLHLLWFRAPEGLDLSDSGAVAAWVGTLPPEAFVLPWLAHLSQAGVGGGVAARLGRGRPVLLSGWVGGLTLLGSAADLWMLPGPAWRWSELALVPLLAWAAGALEARRRSARTAVLLPR